MIHVLNVPGFSSYVNNEYTQEQHNDYYRKNTYKWNHFFKIS